MPLENVDRGPEARNNTVSSGSENGAKPVTFARDHGDLVGTSSTIKAVRGGQASGDTPGAGGWGWRGWWRVEGGGGGRGGVGGWGERHGKK